MSSDPQAKKGMLFAAMAFVMWGVAPIYFKQLLEVPALEILTHRVIWSVLFLAVIVGILKQWHKVQFILAKPKYLMLLVLSASILGFNWGLFIWAVNNDHMLDASLGYYINPLLNVLLGVTFLHERLRKWQMFAVALAASGVLIQVISFGSFPTVAFALAGSFAIYGLIRKKMPVESLPGLLLEAVILLPAALLYWYFSAPTMSSNMSDNTWQLNLLLVSAGIVTTLPLLCFTAAAKRLQYSTIGIFQYIGPSLMFLLAVLLYGEAFDMERVITFACIWTALVIFTWDSWRFSRRQVDA